jgi:hypothetical protein
MKNLATGGQLYDTDKQANNAGECHPIQGARKKTGVCTPRRVRPKVIRNRFLSRSWADEAIRGRPCRQCLQGFSGFGRLSGIGPWSHTRTGGFFYKRTVKRDKNLCLSAGRVRRWQGFVAGAESGQP